MGNLLATVWGLITFAGFVVALLLPKAEDTIKAFWETAEEGARARARKWSFAVRTAPVVTCGVVAVVCVAAGLALRGSERPTGVDVGLLVVAGLTQAGFAVAVLYLVARVPRAMRTVLPTPVGEPATLRSEDGPRTALRFVNESHATLQLLWVDHSGTLHERGLLPPDSERAQLTYAGHPFVIRLPGGGRVLAVFVATAVPGTAILTDAMTRTDRAPGSA
ncbi:hypothetical protein [Streptomyces sp. NPDC057877]|uniref:hypothetical protein n=1 Tax=Streptomyces sp. NPDC057877 TaxID=3346269 RepID=UPI0036CD08C0